jgi:hypothetical protein
MPTGEVENLEEGTSAGAETDRIAMEPLEGSNRQGGRP